MSGGNVFNINADTVAGRVAARLRAAKLFLVSNVPGVLRDKDDPSTRMPKLTAAEAREQMASGVISGGMIPKVEESLAMLEEGIEAIHIVGHRSADVDPRRGPRAREPRHGVRALSASAARRPRIERTSGSTSVFPRESRAGIRNTPTAAPGALLAGRAVSRCRLRSPSGRGHQLAAAVRADALHRLGARDAERALEAADPRRSIGRQRRAAALAHRPHLERHATASFSSARGP